MEVDKFSFYPLLVDILTDISEAHFVAIDLELSGVPSKQSGAGNATTGKPTLQERYLETKEAAERYQILQIGLTCVKQDVENGKYVLKPYNFDLNPLIEQRGLDIERIFSFQSGAVEFLLKVGFDMSRPFHAGVSTLYSGHFLVGRRCALRFLIQDNADTLLLLRCHTCPARSRRKLVISMRSAWTRPPSPTFK